MREIIRNTSINVSTKDISRAFTVNAQSVSGSVGINFSTKSVSRDVRTHIIALVATNRRLLESGSYRILENGNYRRME